MAVRRIVVLAGWSLLCVTPIVSAQSDPLGTRQDVVAVVLSGAGSPAGSIAISYPDAVRAEQIGADLNAVANATGCRVGAPSVSPSARETTAMAAMQPGAGADAQYGEPVWPVVLALGRYNEITVTVLGAGFQAPVGLRENRYVSVNTSGGGGVWQYHVWVKDRSFGTLDALKAVAPAGGAAREAPTRPSSQRRWPLIVALAVALGALVFVLMALLAGRRSPRKGRTVA